MYIIRKSGEDKWSLLTTQLIYRSGLGTRKSELSWEVELEPDLKRSGIAATATKLFPVQGHFIIYIYSLLVSSTVLNLVNQYSLFFEKRKTFFIHFGLSY